MTRFWIVVLCTIVLINSLKHHSVVAVNKAHKFNVLLNLYKMNPLKESNIYKQFIQQTMSKTESSKIDPSAFESNEGTKRRTDLNLKRIEKIIHGKRQIIQKHDETYYNINYVEPEKFSLFVVTKSPDLPNPKTSLRNLATDHLNSIFRHIESDETDQYTTNETEQDMATTEFNIIETSPTTFAYKELTTKTNSDCTTKSSDSIEFDKFTENKNYDELFLPVVNKDFQKNNELIIPVYKEIGLSLPINKYDKSESDLNLSDNTKKTRHSKDWKHKNEVYFPNSNKNQINGNDIYMPNFNLKKDKRDNGLKLPYNDVTSERKNKPNIPNNSIERSKDENIMFYSNNRIDERNNDIYLPVNNNIVETKHDMYRQIAQRKDELYLPIDYNVDNENSLSSKNNLKGNVVNLQNQMYYAYKKGREQEVYLPVDNHANERETDDKYLPIDKINSDNRKEIYLPIVTKVDLENQEYNEINLQNILSEKKKEIFLNNRSKNEMNLANRNMFNKGGTNSVLDVVILR